MAIISLRVSDMESDILKSYAKYHNTTVSEIIRNTMFEHIEDEYDLKVFEKYKEEKEKGILKTRPIDKLWEEV